MTRLVLGPDGGYLVPDEIERAVNRAVQNVSPIRAIAGVRQVSGSVYKKPFAITGAESGWVREQLDHGVRPGGSDIPPFPGTT